MELHPAGPEGIRVLREPLPGGRNRAPRHQERLPEPPACFTKVRALLPPLRERPPKVREVLPELLERVPALPEWSPDPREPFRQPWEAVPGEPKESSGPPASAPEVSGRSPQGRESFPAARESLPERRVRLPHRPGPPLEKRGSARGPPRGAFFDRRCTPPRCREAASAGGPPLGKADLRLLMPVQGLAEEALCAGIFA